MLQRLTLWAIVLVAVSATASAELRESAHDRAYRELKGGGFVSLQSILDWVGRNFEGDVIEVELEPEDDEVLESPLIYEVELLSRQGEVIELIFDPKTGDLVRTEGDGIERARKRP